MQWGSDKICKSQRPNKQNIGSHAHAGEITMMMVMALAANHVMMEARSSI
jgi:hypothetical protein